MYVDGMTEATELAAETASTDPATGLRAVASLRALLESLEELQVENARQPRLVVAADRRVPRREQAGGAQEARAPAVPAQEGVLMFERFTRRGTAGGRRRADEGPDARPRLDRLRAPLLGLSRRRGGTPAADALAKSRGGSERAARGSAAVVGPCADQPGRGCAARPRDRLRRGSPTRRGAFGPGALERTRAGGRAFGTRIGAIPFTSRAKEALDLALQCCESARRQGDRQRARAARGRRSGARTSASPCSAELACRRRRSRHALRRAARARRRLSADNACVEVTQASFRREPRGRPHSGSSHTARPDGVSPCDPDRGDEMSPIAIRPLPAPLPNAASLPACRRARARRGRAGRLPVPAVPNGRPAGRAAVAPLVRPVHRRQPVPAARADLRPRA